MNNPIAQFQTWFTEATNQSNDTIPSACCLSTQGLDGYPNARFVSLKDVIDGKFLVAGSMASRKGQELKAQPKAALTFWWDALERQVRIQGDVAFADEALAQALFLARSRDSQIVSSICRQGAVIENPSELENQFETISNAASAPAIEVPPGWGAILIAPKRIEFMTFRKSRLHERKLYEKGDNWVESYLAP